MATIDIDPKYRLGVAALDSEHAVLIQIANDVKLALAGGRDVQLAGVSAIVDRLIKYAHTHFGHEEQLMAEHRYPGLEDHRIKHKELMLQVEKFADELAGHRDKVALQVNLFMTVWLFDHITKEDAAFARHYLAHHPRK